MIALLSCIGILTGFLSGLLGIGGGLILVPFLHGLFESHGELSAMQMATATSLAIMIPTSLAGVITHMRGGHFNTGYERNIIQGAIFGAVLGRFINLYLEPELIENIFGLFAVLYGLSVGKDIYLQKKKQHPTLSSSQLTYCIIIGTSIANILGIGGSIFIAPLLLKCTTHAYNVIALTALLSLLNALTSTIFQSLSALYFHKPNIMDTIDIASFTMIAVTSTLCAPIGVKISKKMQKRNLKQFLSVLLLGVGMRMLFLT